MLSASTNWSRPFGDGNAPEYIVDTAPGVLQNITLAAAI